MNIIETELPGVLIIEPKVFKDQRGAFFETFHAQRYADHGLPVNFVQDNFSHSTKNVLRGLHYQLEHPQGKLIWVTRGEIVDVAVDIRRNSPSFGQHIAINLSGENPRQVYIPPGFAHGFCVLSDEVDFYYKCTDYYHPASEKGVLWNDPVLNIAWPITNPILSEKDKVYSMLNEINPELLPVYEPN